MTPQEAQNKLELVLQLMGDFPANPKEKKEMSPWMKAEVLESVDGIYDLANHALNLIVDGVFEEVKEDHGPVSSLLSGLPISPYKGDVGGGDTDEPLKFSDEALMPYYEG